MGAQDDRNLVGSIFGSAAEGAGTQGQGGDGAVDNKDKAGADKDTGAEDQKGAEGAKAGEGAGTGDDEGKSDKLYAGRFKSAEELEQAYRSLEGFGTQKAQEAAALRRQLDDLQAKVAPDLTKKQQEDLRKEMAEAVEAAAVDNNPDKLVELIERISDKKAAEKIEAQLGRIMPTLTPVLIGEQIKAEADQFFADFPEAIPYEQQMAAVVKQSPQIMFDAQGNRRPDWPSRALNKVLTMQAQAASQGRAAVNQQIDAQKQVAGAARGGVRQAQDTRTQDEKIIDSIFGTSNEGRKIFDQ